MGACPSSAEAGKVQSRTIDNKIKNDKTDARHEIKLLLLGSGESGKSTIFKQLKIIHQDGFSESERENIWAPTVRAHALENFVDLVKGAIHLKLLSAEQEHEFLSAIRSAESQGVTTETVEIVQRAWNTSEIQTALTQKHKFQLCDSAEHFLHDFARVYENDYLPSDDDILACRVRTTGVSEMRFEESSHIFRLVDVGGQRNERKKWIHCFDDVQAVIFVTAISEYDQLLFEDEKTNRLQDSLKLFGEISNTRFFSEAAMILFLNKKDLFEQKIKTIDLSVCFPDYTEGHSYDHAVDFIKRKFREKTTHEVFTHVTCATSTGNIRFVFDSVKESFLLQSATAGGLL